MSDLYGFEGQEGMISPQLVFYPELIRENIRRMIQAAGGPGRLWPHMKTHKTAEVLRMQLEEGIDQVKCATIAELEVAATAGVRRIVLAYPLVGPNIGRFLAAMAAYPQTELFAIADDSEQVRLLGQVASERRQTVSLLMDVDLGQHRTGVPMDRIAALYRQWDAVPGIHMCGAHCYDGHRHESDARVRMEAVKAADEQFLAIRKKLEEEGYDCSVVIFGGTPSFPCHLQLTEDYVSPGTCVLWDFGYRDAYPDLDYIPAAAVLTRVVSRPSEDTFTLDLGTKAIASDPPVPRAEIVGYEYAETVMQNEEHLVLRVPEAHIADIPPIGTVLFALPAHVCPTSALYPCAAVVERGKLSGYWQIAARNRIIHL